MLTRLVVIISIACFGFLRRGAASATEALAKARELHEARKFQEAVNQLDEAIRLDPKSAEAYFLRGAAYVELNKHDRPLDDFTEAIRLKPDYAQAYYLRGKVYSQLERHNEAIPDFTQSIRLQADFAEAKFERGVSYFGLKKYRGSDQRIHGGHQSPT